MSEVTLLRAVAESLERLPGGALRVGFSGGLDSTVLLHLLAALPVARARGLAAIHVDHGLQAQSLEWGWHCAEVAAQLDVPLQVQSVDVARDSGAGIEAAARAARHAAFAQHLPEGSILALAHHRDDQVETTLLRMLNAAGSEGVAGMRAWRRFGHAWLWRPLLAQPRNALVAYAHAHGLSVIEDPSNNEMHFSRNRLRHRVLPTLREQWPDADARIAAAALRLREDSDALDSLAQQARASLQGAQPGMLQLSGLRALPAALRRRVLGQWLDDLRLPRPPPGIWRRLDRDLIETRENATPLLAWKGAELRRYRDAIHALRPAAPPSQDWCVIWDGRQPITLPHGFGTLALESARQPAPAFEKPLEIRARRGGERILCHGLQRPLRLRLQELAVPPWQRERLPLLFSANTSLLAAADLAVSDTLHQWLQEHHATLHWTSDD